MLKISSGVVCDIPVLNNAECGSVRQTIMQLRPEWLLRNPWAPFYTLGAASYMDAATSQSRYHELAARYNPLLRENFAWIFERVARILSDELGEPVSYADHLALPGFHIYLSSKLFEKPVASIHCDSQYQFHDWSGLDADLSQPISFTLSIALPSGGGGLNTWDVIYGEMAANPQIPLTEYLHSRPCSYHSYSAGYLALHSGHILHQAAPAKNVQPDDERITLQGHGIRAKGTWLLYW